MIILILNWRDIKNPNGGGAEILTHELAKNWVRNGNTVIQFSSKFNGAKSIETIDGVKVIRKGNWWNVHFFAFFYYLKKRSKVDVIIDEVHWFPFFSALYARKKTIALTCEVASKLFFTIFPYPIAIFFRFIEKLYLYLYRDVPTMTISESTKKDLVREGINSKLITILRMGINIPKNMKKYPKEKNPTFIFLARLNKQKGIFDVIEAFAKIKNQSKITKAPQLWIVGSGEDDVVNEVKKRVINYELHSSVKFFGFVTEQKKFELLARSHILLVPSAHEGWGLTVHEAATQKTPSVVYNVPGLKDTVKANATGIILKKNIPEEMAKSASNLLRNKIKYSTLQSHGLVYVKKMTWDKAGEISLNVINSI